MKKLSLCHQKLENFDKSEFYLQAALKARASPAEILLKLGYLQMEKKDFASARMILYKASTANKNSILSWLGLGKSCYHLKQYNDAVDALRQANFLDVLNSEVWCYQTLIVCDDVTRNGEIIRIVRELCKVDVDDKSLFFMVSF